MQQSYTYCKNPLSLVLWNNFFENPFTPSIITPICTFLNVLAYHVFTVGQKISKSPGKKLVESNQSKIFTWNCISGSFKLFPSSKIDFWPFLKLQKMEFGQNNFSWNWFIWLHEIFWPGLFLIFWPTFIHNGKKLAKIAILRSRSICLRG